MSDTITWDKLREAIVAVRHDLALQGQPAMQAVVVTPLFNNVGGCWSIPYNGKQYMLVGERTWQAVLATTPLVNRPSTLLYGLGLPGSFCGVPVYKDDDLAKTLILHLLTHLRERADDDQA